MYRREIVDHQPVATSEITEMVKLLARADLQKRLDTLRGVPLGRCFVSNAYRGFLSRALATQAK